MKYIYYMVAVVIVLTGLSAYGIFDTRIEVSKPYISVNDRIISEEEFSSLLAHKPSYMSRDLFAESLIQRQLLIQEAVRQEINKDEDFRQSVENFYEQSLIKILVDRKLSSLVVDVSDDDIDAYRKLLDKRVVITKIMYTTLEEAESMMNGKKEVFESDFADLSDDLRFIVSQLHVGKFSEPQATDFGCFVYRIDSVTAAETPSDGFDMRKVSVYLQDKKKEKLMNDWIRSIRESAQIWRKK